MGLQNAVTSFLDTIQVNLQVQNVLYEICQAVDEHANLKALAEIGSQRAQVDAKLQRWQVEKQMLLDKVNKLEAFKKSAEEVAKTSVKTLQVKMEELEAKGAGCKIWRDKCEVLERQMEDGVALRVEMLAWKRKCKMMMEEGDGEVGVMVNSKRKCRNSTKSPFVVLDRRSLRNVFSYAKGAELLMLAKVSYADYVIVYDFFNFQKMLTRQKPIGIDQMVGELKPSQLKAFRNVANKAAQLQRKLDKVSMERDILADKYKASEEVKGKLVLTMHQFRDELSTKQQAEKEYIETISNDNEIITFLDRKVQHLNKQLHIAQEGNQQLQETLQQHQHQVSILQDFIEVLCSEKNSISNQYKRNRKTLVKEVFKLQNQNKSLSTQNLQYAHNWTQLTTTLSSLSNI